MTELQEEIKLVKAIDIFSTINSVKDSNKQLVKEGNKRYLSEEDARAFLFVVERNLKKKVDDGKHYVGWLSPDLQYFNRCVDESLQEMYKLLESR